ncbi:MAG: hypothetical protein PHE48_00195 [Candidatus Daviesbacteria bacterium]|nr:hypothetical protein [Candidatus Daviesbacteria bacterium]
MNLDTFLNKIVFGWIKHDLERMTTEIPALDGAVGNINFPLALCVLAYMEYLGGFLLGEEGNFTDNSKEYIDKCFVHKDEYPIDILRDIFRNGLAHEYFARGAISRNNLRPAVYKQSGVGAILDVETLVKDFLDSLDKFKTQLTEEKYKERMSKALDEIKRFKTKHTTLIDGLREGQIYASTNIHTSSSSRASGYPGPIKNTTTLDPSIK